jgi:hypothetical protein
LAFFISCEKTGETRGYFVDDDIYEVIAYGQANPQAKILVQKRTQAKMPPARRGEVLDYP